MSERDPNDERECVVCGLLESDCACTKHSTTPGERAFARAMRLTRAELESLTKANRRAE